MSVDAYMLRDVKVDFRKPEFTFQITVIPENISPKDTNELSWNLCHQLRQSLARLDKDQRQLNCTLFPDDRKAKICLEGTWINHLVNKIGVNMVLNVIYTCNLCDKETFVWNSGELYTAGMLPRYSCKDWVLMYEGTLYNAPKDCPQTYGNLQGKLTITISGVPNNALKKPQDMFAMSIKTERLKDCALFAKRIFIKQFETDVEIVSANGSKHPCHKIFLTGNSSVFQAMFKGDSFMEGETKSVVLENISERGLVGLLNYLYCIDSEDAEENETDVEYDSEVCMELLQASEEYSMTNLQDTMKRIFLNKPSDWFQDDTALQLFCFSRNAENCQELVTKCIQVLQSKFGEIKNSDDYKKLFKDYPEAAMDLCNRLFAHLSTNEFTK